MIILEQIDFGSKKVELIVGKTQDVKWTKFKQEVGKERDVSVHETDFSVAEDTSIEGADFKKEAGLEKDITKAVHVVIEEKDVLLHEAGFLSFHPCS